MGVSKTDIFNKMNEMAELWDKYQCLYYSSDDFLRKITDEAMANLEHGGPEIVDAMLKKYAPDAFAALQAYNEMAESVMSDFEKWTSDSGEQDDWDEWMEESGAKQRMMDSDRHYGTEGIAYEP